jgi:SSS family solute:Na+ symporter
MFNTLDWIIVGIYCVGLIALATYVSRTSGNKERTAEDYFLAGRSLPWWAIGASLIAANISAEQIIGMSGQGFVVGMAYSSVGTYCRYSANCHGKIFLTFISRKEDLYNATVLRAKV